MSLKFNHTYLFPSQDRPRRPYGSSRSPTRPSVLDGLVPSAGGSQPVGPGASPDRRYPGTAGVPGQRYPAGGSSPLRGGYSPGGRYPGSVGGVTTSPGAGSYPTRTGPYGVGSPDRGSGLPGQLGPRSGGATPSPTGRKYPLGGPYGGKHIYLQLGRVDMRQANPINQGTKGTKIHRILNSPLNILHSIYFFQVFPQAREQFLVFLVKLVRLPPPSLED